MSENDVSPSTTRPKRRRGLLIGLGLGLVAAVAAGMGWYFHAAGPARELAERSTLGLDLNRPDALIESASLSRLPKDLLEVPMLRDILTEDFVFYYQNNADRLGLIGSLRRIVYEHDLKLQDSLIEELLDQPAQVALWRGADGRPKHFLILMQRGGLAKVLEPLARVALDDRQLRQDGELRVDGDSVPLYRLRYNADRELLFASHGDRLLVLSSPGMLFDGALQAADATEQLEDLLDGDDPFPERFGLKPRGELSQRIVLGADLLALGYRHFIPAFAGLRFEKGAQGWHSFLALDEVDDQPALDFAPVWQAMPMGASACVALPVVPGQEQKLLQRLGADAQMAKSLSQHLSGAAGLCWYADSRLHSPLLVGRLSAPPSAEMDDDLGKLFGSVIGAHEAKLPDGAFPVAADSQGDTRKWRRQVSSNFGQYPASQAESPYAVSGKGFFRVSLARHGETLLFSLDDRLVDKALDTLDKRFPPLAEVLPSDALVPLYLAPETLATLFRQETLDSLPQDMEPVFRNAAETHLLPKLKVLAGQRKYALSLPAGIQADASWKWLPLEWRAL
ncbi:DUF2138 domain-containing protein [Pseudomonas jinjuensis]|uniref:Uncharacterized conserved protein YfaA, DUF2138 family n=1 Tax=Pseudomonas jinjuensis TaxID=198616 RepID=A0A1H0QJH9_9PSED|nr:DUF2138 domain-containing protein [Pseudomonas jinjuensis]SDP17477.1 Uncharacterized conserved protein YfaA, DUF2138 family [Pseudomonas jinjuensis]